jgi:chitinase
MMNSFAGPVPNMAAFVAGAAVIVAACAFSPSRDQRDGRFVVAAYYSGDTAEIDRYPVGELTHIIFSFLHLRGNELAVSDSRDSATILHLVSLKKRFPDLKILLSLGGWGGCKMCSEVFAAEEGRKAFAASTRDLLKSLGADGIDLDWEYPAIQGYPGHRFTPDDRHNFTLLLRELRSALGPGYELSFAAGGFTEFLHDAVEWDQVMPLVDRVNVMSYDLVNATSEWTGHHTPLYSTADQRESTDNAVRYLDSLGIPPGKIVIGAAFYARVWEQVQNKNNGLYQHGKFKDYVIFRNFGAYFGTIGGFTEGWDTVAQAPYRYSAAAGVFATFDDARSISLKTRYAMKHHLGGIMFWELSADRYEHGLVGAIDSVRKGG